MRLQTIKHYIQKRRHTVHNSIQSRDVLKEYEGAERRIDTPPCLFWMAQDMTVPERREYGAEGGEGAPPPPESRTRVAPQAGPTIAEVRPRGNAGVGSGVGGAMARRAHQ